ncbi:hypothetical protein [Aquisalinus flavus]|uniref:Uncharacterized protein n=1 Tax=Aquisalinus flavus TaxID=1526572 RepID=A0A8J2V3I9_9PROT|nr:hypothetical protein [Aquisalinus flavus]MBD0425386.1 hypothetical protein [Aquisalinus flavus]GGD16482.1 hypothetical protein GCM10011342_26570 [Aquisalinus flavus]
MSREGPLTENSSLERLRREVSNLEPRTRAETRQNNQEKQPNKAGGNAAGGKS